MVDIIGYEGLYKIDRQGDITNRYGKKLKPHLGDRGYFKLVLCKNGKTTTVTIHRLIALHFIPNLENKPHVNHINSVKTDNRIENLEWCTHLENMQHYHKSLPPKQKRINEQPRAGMLGERNWNSKLTLEDVLSIKEMLKSGVKQKDIATLFNVKAPTIQGISSGKAWKHVN